MRRYNAHGVWQHQTILVSAIKIFFFFSYFFSKRKKAVCGADTSKSGTELVPATPRSIAKGDNPDDKSSSQYWEGIRRIAKVAFCFAMTAFFFTVYILQAPYCCEAANTLSTFTLRYPNGPPPVWAVIWQVYEKYRRQGSIDFWRKWIRCVYPFRYASGIVV